MKTGSAFTDFSWLTWPLPDGRRSRRMTHHANLTPIFRNAKLESTLWKRNWHHTTTQFPEMWVRGSTHNDQHDIESAHMQSSSCWSSKRCTMLLCKKKKLLKKQLCWEQPWNNCESSWKVQNCSSYELLSGLRSDPEPAARSHLSEELHFLLISPQVTSSPVPLPWWWRPCCYSFSMATKGMLTRGGKTGALWFVSFIFELLSQKHRLFEIQTKTVFSFICMVIICCLGYQHFKVAIAVICFVCWLLYCKVQYLLFPVNHLIRVRGAIWFFYHDTLMKTPQGTKKRWLFSQ